MRMRKKRRGKLLPLSLQNLALVNLFTFFGSGSCSPDLQNAQMLLSPTESNPRSRARYRASSLLSFESLLPGFLAFIANMSSGDITLEKYTSHGIEL